MPKVQNKLNPLNNEQFLYTKLRWLTLGEQYDWPTRSYAKHATPFPADLSTLVTGLFPHIRPESGVVLMYSAKDFMPVHRDVRERLQVSASDAMVSSSWHEEKMMERVRMRPEALPSESTVATLCI
jgi:alkylated DNA repair dioxygenase AlkB